jgi:TatD DNase family protein
VIIDTHCHLDSSRYDKDIDKVLEGAVTKGVEKFIIPGADPRDLDRAIELSERDDIYFAVGVHPYHIDDWSREIFDKVSHKKCIAIGECGLDYFRLPEDETEKEQNIAEQKDVFRKQIRLAKELKKPLIVHIRDASEDAKKILLEEGADEVGGVLHCYNADRTLLELADHNFYFGIGGVVTFKNARRLVEVLPLIPKDKLLVETDAPYLTPHPHRGERNEPLFTTFVVEKMAKILNLSYDDVSKITTENSLKLFKL